MYLLLCVGCILLMGCQEARNPVTSPIDLIPSQALTDQEIREASDTVNRTLQRTLLLGEGAHAGTRAGKVRIERSGDGYRLRFSGFSEEGLIYLDEEVDCVPQAGAVRCTTATLRLRGRFSCTLQGTWMLFMDSGMGDGCWDVQQEGQADQQLCF